MAKVARMTMGATLSLLFWFYGAIPAAAYQGEFDLSSFLWSFPTVCFVKPLQSLLESKGNVPHFLALFFWLQLRFTEQLDPFSSDSSSFSVFLFNLPAKFSLQSFFRVLTIRNGSQCLTCLFVVDVNTVTTGFPLFGKNCVNKNHFHYFGSKEMDISFFWDIDQNKLKVLFLG